MDSKRIILANGSRFIRDILERVIKKTRGLEVVKSIQDFKDLEQAICDTDPQWIIVSVQPGEQPPKKVDDAMYNHPGIHFLAIALDGSQVAMKWLEPHERVVEGLNLNEMLAILREESPA